MGISKGDEFVAVVDQVTCIRTVSPQPPLKSAPGSSSASSVPEEFAKYPQAPPIGPFSRAVSSCPLTGRSGFRSRVSARWVGAPLDYTSTWRSFSSRSSTPSRPSAVVPRDRRPHRPEQRAFRSNTVPRRGVRRRRAVPGFAARGRSPRAFIDINVHASSPSPVGFVFVAAGVGRSIGSITVRSGTRCSRSRRSALGSPTPEG